MFAEVVKLILHEQLCYGHLVVKSCLNACTVHCFNSIHVCHVLYELSLSYGSIIPSLNNFAPM